MIPVSLSAPVFDPLGHIRLECLPSSNLNGLTRRVNRVPTLDGGAAVNDFGVSDADRTLRLVVPPDRSVFEAVSRMMRLHPRVHVALRGEVLEAVIDQVRDNQGGDNITMTLLVTRRLAP